MTLEQIINELPNINANEFLISIFFAVVFIFAGIVLGKIVSIGLKRLFKKIELQKSIRPSFVNLIVVVIKWSIYLVFINFALLQLKIPSLSLLITKTLLVIPAIVFSLILIALGFSIAIYLREVVEDSEVTGWRILSHYIFYFILYVFGVYSLKIALISIDQLISNIIIVLMTAIVGVAIAYSHVKNHKRN